MTILAEALRACAGGILTARGGRQPAHRLRRLAAPRRLHQPLHHDRDQHQRRHHPDGRHRLARRDHRPRRGRLPCGSGERHMLRLAASIAGGVPVSLCDSLTSIDYRNANLLAAAILHANGQTRNR